MNKEDVDQLRTSISHYRDELGYVQGLLDPVRQLVETVLLVEQVIKTHFLPESLEETTLGPLLHSRKAFLGRSLFPNVAFAIDVRNRISHYDKRGRPSDADYEKASKALFEVIELHLRELEKQLPTLPDSQYTRTSEMEESVAHTHVETDNSSAPARPNTYATQIERNPRPLLDAVDGDPEVSASTIAEYTFCPRAGLLTHEGGFSDPEEELPSLALLPWYEQDRIEEEYTQAVYVLFALPVGLVAVTLIMSMVLLGHFSYPFLLISLLGVWALFTKRAYQRWRELGDRRLAAQLASECNPDPGKNALQPVDWWGLLLAGYEVSRPKVAMRDEKWKLSGKPRRILKKGSMSIPVHRIRKTEGPILPQHIVRVMAHCHLIETTEGANSPFGVVLFGNTYQGMTIPNTNKNRERFYSALEQARKTILESDAREREPLAPVTGRECSRCHFGCPRPTALMEKTMRYGEALDPLLLRSRTKSFHCDCGDRFREKPKHDANQRLTSE